MEKIPSESLVRLNNPYSDLIGKSYSSDWIVVDQIMVNMFADTTGDHQYIHVDPIKATETQFGGTIVHGFLLLSLLPRLQELSGYPDIQGINLSINYGLDRIRFITPVRTGSRIRANFKIADFIERRAGEYQQVLDIVVDVEVSPKPALVASWISLLAVE